MRFFMALMTVIFVAAAPVNAADDEAAVAAVLDELHKQASLADGEAYFALFAENSAFIGTDPGEYWPIGVFREYANKRFATGTGWTYHPQERVIDFNATGDVAWFHELLLNENFGITRGTGVLVLEAGAWKVAQYHLTIPIPNDVTGEVVRKIRAFEGK